VSLSRLRAHTAALAEELHMDADQARARGLGVTNSCTSGSP
jgi:hypothetical protein